MSLGLHRILIVEDNKTNAAILYELLKRKYTVEVAFSGEDGLTKFERFAPDMLLLDINLPEMDGYEVCRRIRSDEKMGFVKILILSGNRSIDERLEGFKAGADDFITKPFVPAELLAKIEVFLRLKRTEEVDRLKGDLLTLFSHETSTPLNNILSVSSQLLQEPDLPKRLASNVQVIHESARQLADFSFKTVMLCKLKAGYEIRTKSMPLDDRIKNVLEIVRSRYREKDITVRIALNGTVSLEADWSLVSPVLEFILDNAFRFSPVGGEIIIRGVKEENRFVLSIQDQGEGIAPELKARIFEEFVIRDIVHHHRGQGISLAVARRVMEAHRGQIEIESEPDSGTLVKLIFTSPVITKQTEEDQEQEVIRSETVREDLQRRVNQLDMKDIQVQRKVVRVVTRLENETLPRWRRLGQTRIISEIEDFARGMVRFGNIHKLDVLKWWGERLLKAANELDIKTLDETLALFPELLDSLKIQIGVGM